MNLNRMIYEYCLASRVDDLSHTLNSESLIAKDEEGDYLPPTSIAFAMGVLNHDADRSSEVAPNNNAYEAHVISLRESTRMWKFANSYSLSRPFHVFEAISGISGNFDYSSYPELNGHVPMDGMMGHAACTLSHIYLWRKLLGSDHKFFLIFEDDALFAPYANVYTNKLLSIMPEDADLVFINGRSTSKLYTQARYLNGQWHNLPTSFLYSRHQMLKIMASNLRRLRIVNSQSYHFTLGCDGYLLTRQGLIKLVSFIDKHGLGDRGCGAGHNVDHLLGAITTKISDHSPHPLVYDINRNIRNQVVRNKAVLNAYVMSYPLVDVPERLGLEHSTYTNMGSNLSAQEKPKPEAQ